MLNAEFHTPHPTAKGVRKQPNGSYSSFRIHRSSLTRSLDSDRINPPIARLHEQAVAERERLSDDGAAIGRNARGKRAVVTGEEMDEALVVAHDNVTAGQGGPAGLAPVELVLLPQARAAGLVESDD